MGGGPGSPVGTGAVGGVGSPIRTVSGRGRYGVNWRAGHHRSRRDRWLVTVPRTGPPAQSTAQGCQFPGSSGLRLMLLNARSICNKAAVIHDLILEEAADLVFITETWLGPEGGVALSEVCPSGFQVWHQPRPQGRGGGVAVVIRENVVAARGPAPQIAGCETLWFKLGHRDKVGVLLLYRPPSCAVTALPELLESIASLVVDCPRLLVLGDFNLPVDDMDSVVAQEFMATMTTMDLSQIVIGPTHARGHTLDLAFVSGQLLRDYQVGDVSVCPVSWSDHSLVVFHLSCATPLRWEAGPIRLVRPRSRMDPQGFLQALGEFPVELTGDSPEALVAAWNHHLATALERIAPMRPLRARRSRGAPWFTEELREMKRAKRRLERRWRRTKSESDRALVRAFIKSYQVAIRAAKRLYFSALIASADSRPAALFRVTRSLLGAADRQDHLLGRSEEYSKHLSDKVTQIRSELDSYWAIPEEMTGATSSSVIWERFDWVPPEEVDRALSSVSSATCALDPCPSWLVLASRERLRVWVQGVVNASLGSGVFPSALKEALVRPLLKKPSLDPDILDNYRPVSNLPFLGKIVEKVVGWQVQSTLDEADYLDPFQSGFRPGFSTETALVALLDDLWRAWDGRSASILVLLDLSAAFDTVDHGILLDRLRGLGVGGTVLQWFSSFLQGRSQSVVVGEEKSTSRALPCGVPQGSSLSPLLFNIYMKPLGEIIRQFGVRVLQYADDTQLYVSTPGCPSEAVKVMSECLEAVRVWMGRNKLKLNPSKTEWLWVFGPPDPVDGPSLELDGVALPRSDLVRNLGVRLDSQLLLVQQVEAVARGAFAQVRLLRQLRPYLDREALLTVAHALVTSRLDYCNALYLGLPLKTIRKLQLVQNAAARAVEGVSKYSHVTPLLRELHWLPVRFRIQFKVLVIIFKALQGIGPGYLLDRLSLATSARPVRSQRVGLLRAPSVRVCRLATPRARAFSVAGPDLWNSLPSELRSQSSLVPFRKALKTWLFKQAFDP